MAKFGRIWQNLANLAEFGRIWGGGDGEEEEEEEEGGGEGGENLPYVWEHRSSAPSGPLPKNGMDEPIDRQMDSAECRVA